METAVAGIVSMWQALSLVGILGWVILSPFLGLTRILRSSLQPWVVRRVIDETPMILTVQVRQLAPSVVFLSFHFFFACRVCNIGIWTYSSRFYLFVSLCHSTLVFSRSSSGLVSIYVSVSIYFCQMFRSMKSKIKKPV